MYDKGFTLVEIIISILLIGIVIASILPMFFQGFRVLFSSESKTDAINSAKADLINNYIKSTPSTTPTSITLDFGGGTIKTITASSYTIKENYKTPEQDKEELKIQYYVYGSN